MRKIARLSRLATEQQQIIRFDNQQYGQNLTHPETRKGAQFNRSTMTKHSFILRASAAEANSVCLSSNQIGLESRMIAIHQNININQPKGAVNWIHSSYNKKQKYSIYHKPSIKEGKDLVESEQESISFPFIMCKIRRYNQIGVTYLDQDFVKRQAKITGESAWVFQQSFQQLSGQILLDWRLHFGKIWFKEEMIKYFPKTTSVIEEYAIDLAKTFKQYPELTHRPQIFKLKAKQQHRQSQQYKMEDEPLPFESDFFRRLVKHYRREMTLLEQKIQKGFNEPFKWSGSNQINSKIIDK